MTNNIIEIATDNKITVSANWVSKPYNITYDLDGDGNTDTYTGAPTQPNIDETITINNPARTGYTFMGWVLSSTDGDITHAYADNASWDGTATKATTFKNLTTTENATVLLKTIVQKQVDKILNIAYQYHEMKDYKKADEALAEGLKNYPKESQLYYYKGLNKEASDDIIGAIQEYRLAVKVDKNCSIAYYSLGILLEKVGNKKAALEAFETYLSHNTEDENRNKYALERVETLSRECY